MKTANEIYLEKIGSYIFFGKVILKLFILFLIALLFLSCSNDDTQPTCNCNAWVRPISYAKDEKEIIELNHYSNYQPLFAKDNLAKGNKYIG